MSPSLLVVVGALGTQGSGVISAMLTTPESQFQIRALTSDPLSEAAVNLAENPRVAVEFVDLKSQESVLKAFRDANYIFANTAFPIGVSISNGPAAAQEVEEEYGLNIARAASQISSLRHIIWSTLPEAESISNGKYRIPHFQSKIAAERYLQDPANGLVEKTTFLRVGFYTSNLKLDLYKPLYVKASQKYVLILPCLPASRFPFAGDERQNTGTIVRAIFTQPDKTLGKFVLGVSEYLSCSDWARALSTALSQQGTNVDVSFLETTLQSYNNLRGHHATEIGYMLKFFSDFKEESFIGGTAGLILTPQDLGVQGSMISVEDMLKSMNWSSILD
ncbi:hypothetical protein V8C35DRAFT_103285 [Trichoderma chlorosporum]